jgi:hypothetical protein
MAPAVSHLTGSIFDWFECVALGPSPSPAPGQELHLWRRAPAAHIQRRQRVQNEGHSPPTGAPRPRGQSGPCIARSHQPAGEPPQSATGVLQVGILGSAIFCDPSRPSAPGLPERQGATTPQVRPAAAPPAAPLSPRPGAAPPARRLVCDWQRICASLRAAAAPLTAPPARAGAAARYG